MATHNGLPKKQALYDPQFEHDACGVGFVANVNGEPSHEIVQQALTVLKNLTHRGAVGSDPLTGDGAGILVQIADKLYRESCSECRVSLPPFGDYGVGMMFLPKDKDLQASCLRVVEQVIAEEGHFLLGWRDVPINATAQFGFNAKATEPATRQVMVGCGKRPEEADKDWFERQLFIIRRRIENAIVGYDMDELKSFHICSFSSRTVLYKGLFLASQLPDYFEDLNDERLISSFAMVHQRYSSNTFPT